MGSFTTLVLEACLGGQLLLKSAFGRKGVSNFVVVAVLLLSGIGGDAVAQGHSASRNLPVDHWAYHHIRLLRSRGYLENLNPLVQPYRRAEVARGLARLDPDSLADPERRWVELLLEEFQTELEHLREPKARSWGLSLTGRAAASTSQRLDPLRPIGDGGVWPAVYPGAWAEFGPIVANVRMSGNTYLPHDPDGRDPFHRRGLLSDDSYLSLQASFGSVTLGRMKRNWSAIDRTGLLISSVATPYPQLAIELKIGRLELRSFTAELDTLGARKRFLSSHRVDYKSDDLVVSIGESILYAPIGNAFSLEYLSPLEIYFFGMDTNRQDAQSNVALNAQVWYGNGRFALSGEFLLDDIDIYAKRGDAEPLLFALALELTVPSIVRLLDLSARYELVSAWAYRGAPEAYPRDRFTFLDRGLGSNYSDFDLMSVDADIHLPVDDLHLTPTLQLLRQGEGDLRDSLPPLGEYYASRTLFLGTKETTYRFALRGRYQPNRFLWVSWDVGENYVRNARHVEENHLWEFQAVGRLGLRFDLPFRRVN